MQERDKLLKLAERVRRQRKTCRTLFPAGLVFFGVWAGWCFFQAWTKIDTLGAAPPNYDLSEPRNLLALSVADSLSIMIPILLGFIGIGAFFYFLVKLIFTRPSDELVLHLADLVTRTGQDPRRPE